MSETGPMTPDRLAAIAGREHAATAGPWAFGPPAEHRGSTGADCKQPVYQVGGRIVATTHHGQVRVWNPAWHAGSPGVPNETPLYLAAPRDDPDAEFIAHARDDIPWLLAELDRVARERDEAVAKNARNLAADIACQEAADVRTEQDEARVATLVLSLFPGIGLMDMAFEEEGFCVVRGPDLLWGGDVRRFHPPAGVFAGVIGGPPCQAFSQANVMGRLGRQHLASNLIPEFERVVAEATPRWFLMENVKQAPVPVVPEYRVVDVVFNNRHVGGEQNRIRRFSFGTPDGRRLEIEYHALEPATYRPCVTANGTQWDSRSARSARGLTDVRARSRSDRSARMLAHYIEWQGLPAHFLADAPFTVVGKVKAVGNGVPMTMGRAVARAVKRAVLAQVASRAPNR